jgi:uncharacterized protein (DUF433 family)
MNRNDLLARIAIDPSFGSGRPCIRGQRIEVSAILKLLANGWSSSEILAKHPGLTEADVDACIAYGAESTWERDVIS